MLEKYMEWFDTDEKRAEGGVPLKNIPPAEAENIFDTEITSKFH